MRIPTFKFLGVLLSTCLLAAWDIQAQGLSIKSVGSVRKGNDTEVTTFNRSFVSGLPSTVFVIEAEDFDYNGGNSNPQAGVAGRDVNRMPYLGGAYDGLGATEDIDFVNGDGPDSDQYRTEVGADGDHELNITDSLGAAPGNGSGGSIPIAGIDRGSWTMTANFRIGWVTSGEWQNYTRRFPTNEFGGWSKALRLKV